MGGPARGLQASAQGGASGTGDKWSRLARTVSDPISPFMTKALALATVAAVICAAPVAAQVGPQPPPGQPYSRAWPDAADQARDQADRHRYEMERLRLEADQREAFARQQALEARLRVMELQAARQPVPPAAYAPYPTVTPEHARARRDAVVSGTTQIDDWLDRGPR